MQYSGILFSILLLIIGTYFAWWHGVNEIQVGFILYMLILPTFLTAFTIKNRLFKDISRFLLGISFTIAFALLIFTPNLYIKGWIIINFIPGYIYLNKRRAIKNDKICNKCPEGKNIPHCSGYQIYTDRESIFLGQAIQGGISDPFAISPEKLEKE